MAYRNKSYSLKEMPEDIYKLILREQGKKKERCNCQFSMESVIYMLLRRMSQIPIDDLIKKLQGVVDKLEASGNIEVANEVFAIRNTIEGLKDKE